MNTNPEQYFEGIGALPQGAHPLRAYGRGFALSIIITVVAYFIATSHALPRANEVGLLILFALLQCVVQMVCFLHLDARASRARLFMLGAASVVVLILVVGSLWIMFTLNGRMMPSTSQMEQYMNDQSGF